MNKGTVEWFKLKCDKLLHESQMHDPGMAELNALLSLYNLKYKKAQALKQERDRLQRLLNDVTAERDYAYSSLPVGFVEDAAIDMLWGSLFHEHFRHLSSYPVKG